MRIIRLSGIRKQLARQQIVSSYRGLLYVSGKYSLIVLAVLVIGSWTYYLVNQQRYTGAVVPTFWADPDLVIVSGLLLVLVCLVPWILIPFSSRMFRRAPARYVFRRDRWMLLICALIFITPIAAISTSVAIPDVVLSLCAGGWSSWYLWVFAGLGSGFLPIEMLTQKIVRRIRHPKEQALPALTHFGYLRPQNSKVINLDVGALAPRLHLVADALREWHRATDERAPTSQSIWNLAAGLKEDARGFAPREVSYGAWRGAEDLRDQLAEFLRALPRDIVLVGTTTRALEASLEAIRPIKLVTTDREHPSESRLVDGAVTKFGAQVSRVPVILAGSETVSPLEFAERFVTECVKEKASAALISHVSYADGLIMPIADIGRALAIRSPETALIVDGAHAVGQIEVNLKELPFHYYVFSGHKWLFGPPCLGVLIFNTTSGPNRDAQFERLKAELYEALAFREVSTKESTSSISLDPFVGLSAAIRSFSEPGLFDEVQANLRKLRATFQLLVAASPHVELAARVEWPTAPGIANVQKKGRALSHSALLEVRNNLERRFDVVTKVVLSPLSLRLCLPFYLRYEELESAVSAIDKVFSEL